MNLHSPSVVEENNYIMKKVNVHTSASSLSNTNLTDTNTSGMLIFKSSIVTFGTARSSPAVPNVSTLPLNVSFPVIILRRNVSCHDSSERVNHAGAIFRVSTTLKTVTILPCHRADNVRLEFLY